MRIRLNQQNLGSIGHCGPFLEATLKIRDTHELIFEKQPFTTIDSNHKHGLSWIQMIHTRSRGKLESRSLRHHHPVEKESEENQRKKNAKDGCKIQMPTK